MRQISSQGRLDKCIGADDTVGNISSQGRLDKCIDDDNTEVQT